MAFSYEIEIKDRQLRKMLVKKLAKLGDLSGFHADVGEHLLNTTKDRFDSETAPDGSKWPSLSPVTIASRLKREGNAGITKLRESGRLIGSINYRASAEDTRIGSPVIYAAIHNFGGEAGRGHAIEIPQRQYIGVSPEDEQVIFDMAEDWLEN